MQNILAIFKPGLAGIEWRCNVWGVQYDLNGSWIEWFVFSRFEELIEINLH